MDKAYFRLMRLHSLTGAWLLMWPSVWSVVMNMVHVGDLVWVPVLVVGTFLMRSLGCIVNDWVDIDIDKKVKRTKTRPLASGELKKSQALKLALVLSVLSLIVLLSLGWKAIILGGVLCLLIVLYPFSKRFLYYPQFLLGFIFSSGALFGCIAITGNVNLAAIMVYLGSVFWVVYYDTVYAHQDKIYDLNLNLKSTALSLFGKKKWLSCFYQLAVSFWLFAGVLAREGIIFYLFALGAFFMFRFQLKDLDLDNPDECMKVFSDNNKIAWVVFAGVLLGKITY